MPRAASWVFDAEPLMAETSVGSLCKLRHHPLFHNQPCCGPTLEPNAIQLDGKISDLESLSLVNARSEAETLTAEATEAD